MIELVTDVLAFFSAPAFSWLTHTMRTAEADGRNKRWIPEPTVFDLVVQGVR